MRKTCDPPGISAEFHSLATYVGHNWKLLQQP